MPMMHHFASLHALQKAHIKGDMREWNVVFENPRNPPPHPYMNNQYGLPSYESSVPGSWKNKNSNIDDGFLSTSSVSEPSPISIDRDLSTRNIAITGTVLGCGLGIACVAIGLRMILEGRTPLPPWLHSMIESIGVMDYYWITQHLYIGAHQAYRFPRVVAVMLPLFINILVTLALDCMNILHSVTLRWALWREGRLDFNSNLRLFTSAKHHAPNSWAANFVSALSLVFAYGCTSLVTFDVYIKGSTDDEGNLISAHVDGERYALDFNGWAIFGLGSSLLLQATISLWSLAWRPNLVETWSCNPLTNTKVCIVAGLLLDCNERNPSAMKIPGEKELLSLNRSQSSARLLTRPRAVQRPPRDLVPAVRRITALLWAIFGIVALWTITLVGCAVHAGTANTQSVFNNSGRSDAAMFWQYYGQVSINFTTTARRDWLGIIVQTAVQSCITLGLHCVELLVSLHWDEKIWRKAASKKGARLSDNTIFTRLKSWPILTLFAFKATTHWVFGNALAANVYITMNLLPVIALAVSMLFLALFAEYLARVKPKGPQPATYGNLQAIEDLVDSWGHGTIWWGDKGNHGYVRRAGTADYPLPEMQVNALYRGIRTQLDSATTKRICF
jgi:hypothetical protein